MRRLSRGKAEHLVLPGPLRWQVAEASNAHAMGKSAFDGRFDKVRREESKRDSHIDVSRAALFPLGDAVRTCCWISDEFIKPAAATGNRGDQSRPRLRTYRASLFGANPLGQKNFPMPPCRYLPPRDRKSTRWLGKMNDQLVHLDLNVRDVSKDETAVVNGL